MLDVAEHRRAELGVVAAHAVEDARAVVQAVRQDVDLGVLPGDEISVHPDEVGGLHVHCTPIRGSRALPLSPAQFPSSPPRSAVRKPPSSARCTADSTAAASLSKPRPWRSISAAERNIASGLAIPCPAMSGAEPWTGSNRPGPSAPSEALGQHADRARQHGGLVAEDVAEQVLGQDHVEVASAPRRAAWRRCRRARARARPRELRGVHARRRSRATAGRSRARWPCRRSRHACARRFEGDAGDPLDLLDGVGAEVGGRSSRCAASRRSRCRR